MGGCWRKRLDVARYILFLNHRDLDYRNVVGLLAAVLVLVLSSAASFFSLGQLAALLSRRILPLRVLSASGFFVVAVFFGPLVSGVPSIRLHGFNDSEWVGAVSNGC